MPVSGIKISQLGPVSSAALTDLIPAVQSGVTYKETLQQLLNLFVSKIPLTDGQLIIGDTGNPPSFSTLTAGTNITISNGPGSITINSTAAEIDWNDVTGTSATMIPNNGYVSNNLSIVTLTLPTSAAFGTIIYVIGNGSGGWTISQNAGQQISIGSVSTTSGVSGSVSSTNQHDSVALLCVQADTNWVTLGGPQGNLTIV